MPSVPDLPGKQDPDSTVWGITITVRVRVEGYDRDEAARLVPDFLDALLSPEGSADSYESLPRIIYAPMVTVESVKELPGKGDEPWTVAGRGEAS